MKRVPPVPGQRVGRLVVLERNAAPRNKKYPEWNCRCDCGTECTVLQQSLLAQKTRSCGCLGREEQLRRNTTHGKSKTSEYRIWMGIRRRCENGSASEYRYYGGRGIKVCERWQSFENFLADMGSRPSLRHSIDRIDNDGNYEPGNCRWATHREQVQNTSKNLRVRFKGRVLTASQWADELGLHRETVRKRAHWGMPLDLPSDRRGNRGKRGDVEILP